VKSSGLLSFVELGRETKTFEKRKIKKQEKETKTFEKREKKKQKQENYKNR
jgi:hypothetical protein